MEFDVKFDQRIKSKIQDLKNLVFGSKMNMHEKCHFFSFFPTYYFDNHQSFQPIIFATYSFLATHVKKFLQCSSQNSPKLLRSVNTTIFGKNVE